MTENDDSDKVQDRWVKPPSSINTGTVEIDSTPATGTWSGLTITLVSGSTIAIGDVCRINGAGQAVLARANVAANASGLVMATQSLTNGVSGKFLLIGTLASTNVTVTVGAPVYLSTTGTTLNTLTTTAPSGSGNIVQILGWGLSANSILFRPELVQVELS